MIDIRTALNDAKQRLIDSGPEHTPNPFFTESQRKAVSIIQDHFWAKVRMAVMNEPYQRRISGRHQPLLCGLSGSGKSHCVREAARQLEVSFYQVNISDWIVRGAAHCAYTLDAIRSFVEEHQAGLIFLDEIDKLRGNHVATSAWNQSIATEVFAFLDAKEALKPLGWDKKIIKKLQYFLVVGAGAWQETLSANTRKVGFGENKMPSTREQIEESKQIPFELLARFSPDIIRISYPNLEDFKRGFRLILRDTGIKSCPENMLIKLAERALDQGRGARALENFVTKLEVRQAQKADKSLLKVVISDDIIPPEGKEKQKFYNHSKVLKRFQKRCDAFAESSYRLGFATEKFPDFNIHLPLQTCPLSHSLQHLACNLIKLSRGFGSKGMTDLQESIDDSRRQITTQFKKIRSELPTTLADLVVNFLFAQELYQGEYDLFCELSQKDS